MVRTWDFYPECGGEPWQARSGVEERHHLTQVSIGALWWLGGEESLYDRKGNTVAWGGQSGAATAIAWVRDGDGLGQGGSRGGDMKWLDMDLY